MVRLIQKWLNAGVLEEGQRMRMKEGTPQGGSASPLLANIYLHYAFDLWVKQWGSKQAAGAMVGVRYADDIVLGFQRQADAERMYQALGERLGKFGLELHPDKTRLLECGPYAEDNCKRRGQSKPATFDFLGFTHICGKTRGGRYTVLRQTMRKRLQAKLGEVKAELRRRMHDRVPAVGKWLHAVVEGHIRYYGVPTNYPALAGCGKRISAACSLTLVSPGGRDVKESSLLLPRVWNANIGAGPQGVFFPHPVSAVPRSS